jgi:hypothetical protein
MARSANIVAGKVTAGDYLYAAHDSAARYCQSRVAEMRFAALLTPFKSEADAKAALAAAGATEIGGDQ